MLYEVITIGGIIPDEDVPKLREMGVKGVYGPGTPTDLIVSDIQAFAKRLIDS